MDHYGQAITEVIEGNVGRAAWLGTLRETTKAVPINQYQSFAAVSMMSIRNNEPSAYDTSSPAPMLVSMLAETEGCLEMLS